MSGTVRARRPALDRTAGGARRARHGHARPQHGGGRPLLRRGGAGPAAARGAARAGPLRGALRRGTRPLCDAATPIVRAPQPLTLSHPSAGRPSPRCPPRGSAAHQAHRRRQPGGPCVRRSAPRRSGRPAVAPQAAVPGQVRAVHGAAGVQRIVRLADVGQGRSASVACTSAVCRAPSSAVRITVSNRPWCPPSGAHAGGATSAFRGRLDALPGPLSSRAGYRHAQTGETRGEQHQATSHTDG
jgi:hypothetical protein